MPSKIVNLSASTDVGIPLLQEAVDYATSKDVLVVASAGHDDATANHPSTPYIGYPAAFDNALAVGTATQDGVPNVAGAADQPEGLNGAYPVTTRVYDYAGHTAERTVTVNFDTRPPVGQIVSPVAGLRVHGGAVKVIFSSPEGDVLNVLINGATPTHAAGSATWTAWVVPATGGKLVVQAWDRGGNQTMWTRIVQIIP